MHMKVESSECPVCGTILMNNFLRRHMKFVHGEGVGEQALMKTATPSERKKQKKTSPLAKQQVCDRPRSNISTRRSSTPTKKAKVEMVEVVSKRLVTVREHPKKPKATLTSKLFPLTIVPSQASGVRCHTCGRHMPSKDLKRHLRLNFCSLYLGTSAAAEEPSKSVRTVSGGLPSLGKRAR